MSKDRRLNIVQNEATLLWYSLRMLVGRNLLAVGIISAVVLGIVFSYSVPLRETKLSVLLGQLELFAPLLGIVIFSDLIAGDVEAKRSTLLMSSRYGIVPVVIRKLIHGLIITSATYLMNLLILRFFYTSFNIFPAFLIVVPGALYFGMIGLLAATFASRALAGYAAGTAALILSMVNPETMPLVPTAFAIKAKLATATLFAESNWLFAKAVFVVLTFVMAALVVAMAKKRSLRFHVVIAAALLLACCYSVAHIIWSREVQPDIYFSNPGKQLDVIQNDGELIVRTAAVSVWGRGKNRSNEETSLTDTIYESENGRWVEQRKVEYDPSNEYDLVHLDIDADVVPTTAAIDAKSRAEIKVLAETLHKIYIRIGWELQVTQVEVDGARAMFSRYGDLVEVLLTEPAAKGQAVKLDIAYAGTLRLPSARQRAESNDKNSLFVNSRWYPFVKSWYHEGLGETCTYDAQITVPQGWHVGAGELVGAKGTGQTWRFGTDTPCDRIGLLVTRLDKQQAQVGDITVTVFGRSISDRYMLQIAERACDALRYYEMAFGRYPHRNLSIVEYDHMGAGGIAVPSIVLMNTERCRPEHESDMLNGNVLMATDNGVSIINRTGKLLNHFGTDDGLPGSEVLCMARGASGTLWIGTDKGPASYRDGQWTTYPKCPAGITLAVTTDPAGNAYFGTYRHGIIVYDGKSYQRYDSLNSRLPHNMVTALAYDAQNGLWAGTCLGLLRVAKDSQQVYTKENSALLSNKITDLLADGPNIWIATDAGVAKYDQ